jgi:ribosome maturation factor RimP
VGAVAERVERALVPALADRQLDLESVEVQPAGRRRLVRVLVDRDGGINLDEIADLSRELSQVLDDADAMGEQPYVLEVSSPGVDRPLTLPRHWRRAKGHLVKVQLAGGDSVFGRVKTCTEETATLVTEAGEVTVSFEDATHAQLEIEFTHPDDPKTIEE